MIEFKGECGHTVRARDEDASKMVRCSYCGRETLVPRATEDAGLDSLFEKVEKTGSVDAQATRAGQKAFRGATRAAPRPGARPTRFDPFAVALKLGYVAVALIVLAILRYQAPKLYDLYLSLAGDKPAAPTATPTPTGTAHGSGAGAAASQFGLISPRLPREKTGLWCQSIPAGAEVFATPNQSAVSLVQDANTHRKGQTNQDFSLPKGNYSVEVALRVNHPALMGYQGYPELRKRIEAGDQDEKVLQAFFTPDGSSRSRVENVRGALYLVRTYQVEVYNEGWTPVTALFLPRLTLDRIMEHLAVPSIYNLDPAVVRGELAFYSVPAADQDKILDMLRRVGTVFYQVPAQSGGYRMFRLNPNDGQLVSEQYRE